MNFNVFVAIQTESFSSLQFDAPIAPGIVAPYPASAPIEVHAQAPIEVHIPAPIEVYAPQPVLNAAPIEVYGPPQVVAQAPFEAQLLLDKPVAIERTVSNLSDF